MNASDALIGRTIAGKIQIEALVGRGAMGSVYRGRHVTLEESVAVKVMHGEFATDPEFSERFRREATTMVRLKHPNSVRVLDFGQEPDGLLYLAMEYLDGRDLAAVIRADAPLAPSRIAHLLRQALAAIQTAHDAGIVHRDLKPENILVVEGRDEDGAPSEIAKVCDFGIATIRDAGASARQIPNAAPAGRAPRLTSVGLVVGTPEYMSPEQGRADTIDARSDIYSMGVILYELLTGRLPFEAENAVGLILKHVSEPVVPPSKVASDVDPALEAICLKALQKDPANRFATAREMRAALRDLDEGAPPTARPPVRLEVGADAPPRAERLSSGASRHATTQPGLAVASSSTRSKRIVATALVAVSVGAVTALRIGGRSTPALVASPFDAPSAIVAADVTSSAPAPSLANPVPPPTLPVDTKSPPTPIARADLSPPLRPTPSTTQAPTASVDPPPVPIPTTPPTATSATATTPPPPPPPPPPPAPTAPPFDISTARVSLAGVGNVEGVLKSAVSSALGRTTGAMTACYRADLARASTAESGGGSVHLETDDSGVVNSASARVPFSSAVARCVERAVLGARFAGVDTGSASADVSLTFEVH